MAEHIRTGEPSATVTPGRQQVTGVLGGLPEPKPRRADWMLFWPFSRCLPLDSHYCCVHADPPADR